MEKTYSQKVARVFEIICYILLVPTFISLIYPFIMIIGGLASRRAEVFIFSLIPFLIVMPGIVLLVGYFKHSRGWLEENHISSLWLGTAVYNFLLVLPVMWSVAEMLQSTEKFIDDGNSKAFPIAVSIISGYIGAICFSLRAYFFEKRKNLL